MIKRLLGWQKLYFPIVTAGLWHLPSCTPHPLTFPFQISAFIIKAINTALLPNAPCVERLRYYCSENIRGTLACVTLITVRWVICMLPDNEVLLRSFMGRKLHTNAGSSGFLAESRSCEDWWASQINRSQRNLQFLHLTVARAFIKCIRAWIYVWWFYSKLTLVLDVAEN